MAREWDQRRLQRYLDERIEESLTLEYKAGAALDKGNGRAQEIAKDVSAMANSAGGIIIYGIAEEDGSLRHQPAGFSPVDRRVCSKETLEQIISSNIQPRISGIKIHPVPLEGDPAHVAYVVLVPQSDTVHQVTRNHRYYKRFNFEAVPMEDYEVRDVLGRETHSHVEPRIGHIQRESRSATNVWSIPVFAKNRSTVVAKDTAITVEFLDAGPEHQLQAEKFMLKTQMEPSTKEMYIAAFADAIHRGLNKWFGTFRVTIQSPQSLLLRIQVFSGGMRARWWLVKLNFGELDYTVQVLDEGYLYSRCGTGSKERGTSAPAARLRVLLLVYALLCGGIRRDLPVILEVDEPTFVGGAVAITSGRPDPDWYGHPGATFFYGLAGLLWVDSAIQPHSPSLAERFAARDPALFLYGRLINVWFAFLAAAALVPLGRRVLGARAGERQGLLAALLLAAMPLVIEQITISRTDGLLLFFSTLGVIVWVRLIGKLTTRRIVLAGILTGAATATKYQLGLFAPLLGLTIWAAPPRRRARTVLLFVSAAALTFALLSPYVLIDWRQALQQLRFESRSSHPGADGLNPVGNLLWYLGAALPQTLSVLLPFVLVGAVEVWRDRPVPARRLPLLSRRLSALHRPAGPALAALAPAAAAAAGFAGSSRAVADRPVAPPTAAWHPPGRPRPGHPHRHRRSRARCLDHLAAEPTEHPGRRPQLASGAAGPPPARRLRRVLG